MPYCWFRMLFFTLNGRFSPKNESKSWKTIVPNETYGFWSRLNFVGIYDCQNSDKKKHFITLTTGKLFYYASANLAMERKWWASENGNDWLCFKPFFCSRSKRFSLNQKKSPTNEEFELSLNNFLNILKKFSRSGRIKAHLFGASIFGLNDETPNCSEDLWTWVIYVDTE